MALYLPIGTCTLLSPHVSKSVRKSSLSAIAGNIYPSNREIIAHTHLDRRIFLPQNILLYNCFNFYMFYFTSFYTLGCEKDLGNFSLISGNMEEIRSKIIKMEVLKGQ
jgi:hypothetical protein